MLAAFFVAEITVAFRRKRKSKTIAPAIVTFAQGTNAAGDRQPCVYAECRYGGTVHGPVWGHSSAAVSRCLSELTDLCDCGRIQHRQRFTEGVRVAPPLRRWPGMG